jgi:hypothetical protein
MAYLRVPEIYAWAEEAGIPPTAEALAFAARLSIPTTRRALNGGRVSVRVWQKFARLFPGRDIVTDEPLEPPFTRPVAEQ